MTSVASIGSKLDPAIAEELNARYPTQEPRRRQESGQQPAAKSSAPPRTETPKAPSVRRRVKNARKKAPVSADPANPELLRTAVNALKFKIDRYDTARRARNLSAVEVRHHRAEIDEAWAKVKKARKGIRNRHSLSEVEMLNKRVSGIRRQLQGSPRTQRPRRKVKLAHDPGRSERLRRPDKPIDGPISPNYYSNPLDSK